MDYIAEIKRLKKEKNALILAHFYQIPEIQDLADFVGDSLALAKKGQEASEDLIIVCGVQFMAESAKILSKEKKVLIPSFEAGCPMADMVTGEQLKAYKEKNPDRYIVSYVNTSAEVKTMTDMCVTSSNAVKIMNSIDAEKIMFLPDRNLGGFIKKQMPGRDIALWPGYCHVHDQMLRDNIKVIKADYPNALVLAHPECSEDVLLEADFIGSTKGILDYAKNSSEKQFIIITEDGIIHPLRKANPDKEFILADTKLVCEDMKKITIENLYECLLYEKEEMILEDDVIAKAKKPLDNMLKLS